MQVYCLRRTVSLSRCRRASKGPSRRLFASASKCHRRPIRLAQGWDVCKQGDLRRFEFEDKWGRPQQTSGNLFTIGHTFQNVESATAVDLWLLKHWGRRDVPRLRHCLDKNEARGVRRGA